MYRKSKRGRTLVGKGGKITANSKKNVMELVEAIKNNEDYNASEKITLINDLKVQIENYHNKGKKLTTTGFFGKRKETEIERFLANAGYSIEEFADEAGVSEEEVLDNKNWNNGQFMGKWEVQFNYTGSILKPLTLIQE